MPSSWIGCGGGRRAVSLTRISRPISAQLATRDEPPWDRNGVVMPVSGIRPGHPAHDHEHLQRQHERQAARQQLGERVADRDRGAQPALHDQRRR